MWGKEVAERRLHQMVDLNQPEDVANLVIYLATDKADNINGCVFEVWHGHIGVFNDPPPLEGVLWKDGRFTPEELVETIRRRLREIKYMTCLPFSVLVKACIARSEATRIGLPHNKYEILRNGRGPS